MYEKRCVYSYKSDKGKIYAEMMDKQLSFTEKKFSNEELAVIKQAIWKNCHNKIFVKNAIMARQDMIETVEQYIQLYIF